MYSKFFEDFRVIVRILEDFNFCKIRDIILHGLSHILKRNLFRIIKQLPNSGFDQVYPWTNLCKSHQAPASKRHKRYTISLRELEQVTTEMLEFLLTSSKRFTERWFDEPCASFTDEIEPFVYISIIFAKTRLGHVLDLSRSQHIIPQVDV